MCEGDSFNFRRWLILQTRNTTKTCEFKRNYYKSWTDSNFITQRKNNLFTAQLKSDTRNQINSFKFVFVPQQLPSFC